MSDGLSAYDRLPEPPSGVPQASSVLMRLVDGTMFRYRWAAAGLEPADLDFRAAADTMNLGELLDHLRFLARWVYVNVEAAATGSAPVTYPDCCAGLPDPSGDPLQLSLQTLEAWAALRERLSTLDAETLGAVTLIGGKEPTGFPVWNMINGPMADALTHIGQLNAWRRQLGKPSPRHDVFRGRPPRAPEAAS